MVIRVKLRGRLWDPNVIQTKHVEFIEDVNGYEHIYSRRILETLFINTENIDEIDKINCIDEDEDTESEIVKTRENESDSNEKLLICINLY